MQLVCLEAMDWKDKFKEPQTNYLLAAIGQNVWYPKTASQRGLRILCLDGGGTRGIVAISIMRSIVAALGVVEVCDAFDIIAGTSSTGAFLVGLR